MEATMRQPHKPVLAALVYLAVALATIGGGSHRVCAQETTLPGGTQIFLTPYLWLPGINANIKTPLPRASSVDASVSAVDLLSHLDGVPFLASGEIRDGPFGLLGDVMHLPVSANITTRNVFYQGGNAALTTNVGTAMILYRVLDAPAQFADFGLGFRAWGFGAKLTLNPGQLAGQSVDRRAGWGDPLFGGRYHYDFGNGWGLTAYGDVGGFDLGAHTDWQVIGTVDYAPNPWLNLRLGYRSLNVTYEPSSGFDVGFNVHMKGPILSATFRF
jgi:hypothetical protein